MRRALQEVEDAAEEILAEYTVDQVVDAVYWHCRDIGGEERDAIRAFLDHTPAGTAPLGPQLYHDIEHSIDPLGLCRVLANRVGDRVDRIVKQCLAWARSPEGKAAHAKQMERERKWPRHEIVVPEAAFGLFVVEYELLLGTDCPWLADSETHVHSERGLLQTLIGARMASQRMNAEEARESFELRRQAAALKTLTDEDYDTLRREQVRGERHPLTMNLDTLLLMVDPRLDIEGVPPAAAWVADYIQSELAKWGRDCPGHKSGLPWVDAAHAKYRKTIDDKIAAWHEGAGEGQTLAAFLGMTPEEYATWVLANHVFISPTSRKPTE